MEQYMYYVGNVVREDVWATAEGDECGNHVIAPPTSPTIVERFG